MREIDVLTRRWVAGWSAARGVDVADADGCPLVRVGSASRATEIVCAEPSALDWQRLCDRVAGDPTAMLSVVATDTTTYVAGQRMSLDRDDEVLMLLVAPVIGAAAGLDLSAYDVRREVDGDVVTVRLVDGDRVAAEGTVAVVDGYAVPDRVETTPAYQRRGLGTWVMGELDAWARGRGATSGLLVATPDGAALYARIGWRTIATMRSFRGA